MVPSATRQRNIGRFRAILLLIHLLTYHALVKYRQYPPLAYSLNELKPQLEVVKQLGFSGNQSLLDLLACSKTPTALSEVIRFIQEEFTFDSLANDAIGTVLQVALGEIRQELAANYTLNESARFLAQLVVQSPQDTVIDPFMGSGRLLVAAWNTKQDMLQALHSSSDSNTAAFYYDRLLSDIAGNDLSVIATDASRFQLVVELLRLGAPVKVLPQLKLECSDAFESLLFKTTAQPIWKKKYDLVLMNPPFTRNHRLPPTYRRMLLDGQRDIGKYLRPQMGLHHFALFVAPLLVKQGGRVGAVLPASILFTESGKGIKRFLENHFTIDAVIASQTQKAFSEGSEIREILLAATFTNQPHSEKRDIRFVTIKTPLTQDLKRTILKTLHEPPRTLETEQYQVVLAKPWELQTQHNWLRYTLPLKHYTVLNILENQVAMYSLPKIRGRIVRGVEMYGPNFFLVPNIYWRIEHDSETYVVLEHTENKNRLTIPKNFLKPALRQPRHYQHQITPLVQHYILAIPSGTPLPGDLSKYVEWGRTSKSAEHAMKRWGAQWLHHTDQQLASKAPYGHVFLPDKFSVTATGTLVHYCPSRLTATKNFCVIELANSSLHIPLASWLSSTFFLALFLTHRREIGGGLGRLQIIDYQRTPFFPNLSLLDTSQVRSSFLQMQQLSLPVIPAQLGCSYRDALDTAIANALNISSSVVDATRDLVREQLAAIQSRDHPLSHRRRDSA